jgi:hypothetical protein
MIPARSWYCSECGITPTVGVPRSLGRRVLLGAVSFLLAALVFVYLRLPSLDSKYVGRGTRVATGGPVINRLLPLPWEPKQRQGGPSAHVMGHSKFLNQLYQPYFRFLLA